LPKPSRKGISARKRLRQSLKRRQRNRSIKSKTRTLVGKAIAYIAADVANAESYVRQAISGLDRAAQKGVLHPNAAARSKSRLLKRFNLATANAVAAAATSPAAASEQPAPRRGATASAPKAEESPAKKAPPRRPKAEPKAETKTRTPRAKKTS
jgi:small subunit ribosomal protein S20